MADPMYDTIRQAIVEFAPDYGLRMTQNPDRLAAALCEKLRTEAEIQALPEMRILRDIFDREAPESSAASVGGSPSSDTVAAVLDETAGQSDPFRQYQAMSATIEGLYDENASLRAEVEALKAELVRKDAALWMDPGRQGGSICFMGSRTPIDCCIGYGSIEGFCDDYGVTRRRALVAVAYWTLEMEHRSKADRKMQRDLRAWANVAFWDLARDLDPEAPTVESPPAALLGGQP